MDICLRQEGTLVEVDFNTEWMVQFIKDSRCA